MTVGRLPRPPTGRSSMSVETFVAEPGRLDVVATRLSGATRADVQRAILAGLVRVDGQVRPKSFRLQGGERVDVDIREDAPLQGDGGAVPVRFQDEHLAVIAKPAGLITHPTALRRSGTLVNRLLAMGMPLSHEGGELRPGIVHRLDAGTSGLMIVAKTDEAHRALAAMMRSHDVARRYLAVSSGRSCIPGASRSSTRSSAGRSRSRKPCPPTSSGRSGAPATCSLDASRGRA